MPDIVVIGASAGGLAAVRTVVTNLPANLAASVFVVIHTSPEGPSLLAEILNRSGRLPAETARNGVAFEQGHIYVAPPNAHLLVDDGYLRLSNGPREHHFRPAIDPLFRTAADRFRERVIGVILSGNLADGSHGLMVIKENGGTAIVQDPDEALVSGMPENALLRVDADHVLPARDIGHVITDLVMNGRAEDRRKGRKSMRTRVAATRKTRKMPSPENPGSDALETGAFPGPPSPFTCPDCGGTLWEFRNGHLVRYRCHVGHGFSEDSLARQQNAKLEDTLWSALRALEESIELRKRMAERARGQNLMAVVPSLELDIAEYQTRADALRNLLLRRARHGKGTGRRRARRSTAHDGRKTQR